MDADTILQAVRAMGTQEINLPDDGDADALGVVCFREDVDAAHRALDTDPMTASMRLSLKPIAVCKMHPKMPHYAVVRNTDAGRRDESGKTHGLAVVVKALAASGIVAEICPP